MSESTPNDSDEHAMAELASSLFELRDALVQMSMMLKDAQCDADAGLRELSLRELDELLLKLKQR